MLKSLFNRVAGLQKQHRNNFSLQHRYFPAKLPKFLGTPISRSILVFFMLESLTLLKRSMTKCQIDTCAEVHFNKISDLKLLVVVRIKFFVCAFRENWFAS